MGWLLLVDGAAQLSHVGRCRTAKCARALFDGTSPQVRPAWKLVHCHRNLHSRAATASKLRPTIMPITARAANRWILGLSFSLAAACGPATAVKNDSNSTIYVDLINLANPRQPYPHAVGAGDFMTAPSCAKNVSHVFVGRAPGQMRQFPVARFCGLESCNCTIKASNLL